MFAMFKNKKVATCLSADNDRPANCLIPEKFSFPNPIVFLYLYITKHIVNIILIKFDLPLLLCGKPPLPCFAIPLLHLFFLQGYGNGHFSAGVEPFTAQR